MDELPDEYGLSSDSLRGSHQHIRLDLIGANPDDNIDPYSRKGMTRLPLSLNEIRALEAVGLRVDADGYERPLEPVVVQAPIPVQAPRLRSEDRAPAGAPDLVDARPLSQGESRPNVQPTTLTETVDARPFGERVDDPPVAESQGQVRPAQPMNVPTQPFAPAVDPYTPPAPFGTPTPPSAPTSNAADTSLS